MTKAGKQILKACALEYKEGDNAPLVKAYGEGKLAEKIIEIAKKRGIKIKKDETEEVMNLLKTVSINNEIPVEIFVAISRIYASIYVEALKEKR